MNGETSNLDAVYEPPGELPAEVTDYLGTELATQGGALADVLDSLAVGTANQITAQQRELDTVTRQLRRCIKKKLSGQLALLEPILASIVEWVSTRLAEQRVNLNLFGQELQRHGVIPPTGATPGAVAYPPSVASNPPVTAGGHFIHSLPPVGGRAETPPGAYPITSPGGVISPQFIPREPVPMQPPPAGFPILPGMPIDPAPARPAGPVFGQPVAALGQPIQQAPPRGMEPGPFIPAGGPISPPGPGPAGLFPPGVTELTPAPVFQPLPGVPSDGRTIQPVAGSPLRPDGRGIRELPPSGGSVGQVPAGGLPVGGDGRREQPSSGPRGGPQTGVLPTTSLGLPPPGYVLTTAGLLVPAGDCPPAAGASVGAPPGGFIGFLPGQPGQPGLAGLPGAPGAAGAPGQGAPGLPGPVGPFPVVFGDRPGAINPAGPVPFIQGPAGAPGLPGAPGAMGPPGPAGQPVVNVIEVPGYPGVYIAVQTACPPVSVQAVCQRQEPTPPELPTSYGPEPASPDNLAEELGGGPSDDTGGEKPEPPKTPPVDLWDWETEDLLVA